MSQNTPENSEEYIFYNEEPSLDEGSKNDLKKNIDNHFNIDNLSNLTLNQNTKDTHFEDPTKEYHLDQSKSNFIMLDDGNLKYYESLKKHRLITLHSISSKICDNIASVLMCNLLQEKKYSLRILEFNNETSGEQIISERILLDKRITKDKPHIFIVDLIDTSLSRNFLESIINATESGKQLTQDLLKNDIYIVCKFSSTNIKQLFDRERKRYGLGEWHLDFSEFIFPLLKEKFDLETAKKLYEDIEVQKTFEIYGDNNEEHSLAIAQLLENNTKNEIIRTVYSYVERVRLLKEKGEKQIKRVTPRDLIKSSPIAKEILYVATFFPQLHLREFKELVSFILEDKDFEIKVKEEYTSKKGHLKKRQIKTTINSLEFFRKDPDKIFRKLCLEEMSDEDSKTIIDFNKPHLRKEIKAFFKSQYPDYTRRQFNDIVNFDLLFHSAASNKLVSNIINLVVETALTAPEYYGTRLLMSIGIGKIRQQENTTGDNEDDQIINALNAIIEHQINLERLTLLISELSNHDQFTKTINDFFGSLIQLWKKPKILLDLLWRLRFKENIDQLFWLKRIFNEVSDEDEKVINQAQSHFINLGKQKNVEIFLYLDKLKTWWPRRNSSYKIKKHNLYGLTFLYTYSIATVHSIPKKLYGEFPSGYYLFSKFHELEDKELKKKLSLLIQWLFHPSLKGLTYNNSFIFSVEEIRTNADLIEHWRLLLLGNKKKKEIPVKVKFIVKSLIKEIHKYTDRTTQLSLKSVWTQKAQFYLIKSAGLKYHQRSQRKSLTKRRENLKKILKHFTNA